jgi:cob(I)alamin adenosyltransferase
MKGLIHIYTGTGKGKTTSAVGLAVRALGHGKKVCYTYFHKRPEIYGYAEINNIEKLGAKVLGFAKGHPHLDKSLDDAVIRREANEGISFLKEMLAREVFDMLILDEILISVRDGYLDESELISFVRSKPEQLELVMTGRGATPALMELADYVSEIREIKHPYQSGIMSRKGIEF